ncbi:MAG: Lrp/AsnC family transcriptional regulator [Desulfovibrio sp.]|nr:Lrp/AsnC family transcriptional regulator [Desulfovibrio sp.]
MAREFTEKERAVLGIVQADLPDSLTPFADIASACGTDEDDVLTLLRALKASGTIRRFGASIRHRRTAWTHNAMVAWKIAPEQAEGCGKVAAGYQRISHVYYRPSPSPDWPYTFYTMIHGKSAEECEKVIRALAEHEHFNEHAVLYSIKELKKTSMTYFPAE